MKNGILTVAILLTLFGAACTFEKPATPNTNASNTTANVDATPESTPESAAAQSQAAAASALVSDLYKQHDAKKSPFFQTKSRTLVDKFFTKRLGDLIWKDANSSSGEVGAIDADPLYSGQDLEIKNLAIGAAVVKSDTATVPVTFANYGTKQTVTFTLKQNGTAWKIDDIGYGGGDSLMKWLKNTYPDKPSGSTRGEFEGKYQVGETTCTVKPVKMAFEIRWVRGTGTEMFFYKDANVFESEEDKSGGRNEFRFDDENYNSGTFVRADGNTFPVKRMN
ncbi:MAG: DUF3828 domain-containing protein [Pyrinomonadaceae bacterium]